jgi:hypothetical protein
MELRVGDKWSGKIPTRYRWRGVEYHKNKWCNIYISILESINLDGLSKMERAVSKIKNFPRRQTIINGFYVELNLSASQMSKNLNTMFNQLNIDKSELVVIANDSAKEVTRTTKTKEVQHESIDQLREFLNSGALQFAAIAISQLSRIPKFDTARGKAIAKVKEWINENE